LIVALPGDPDICRRTQRISRRLGSTSSHTVVHLANDRSLRIVRRHRPAMSFRVRERLNLSRGVFAAYLRTNVRTLENWEQGRARPNAQAALLIHLVKPYPDTVQRLAAL